MIVFLIIIMLAVLIVGIAITKTKLVKGKGGYIINENPNNQHGEIRKYELCTVSLPTVTLNYEMDISGWYRFNVSLSSSYSSNVTVTFRIDTSNTITAKAKYVSITVTAGNTYANEPIWRDLSDDTYHIYDAVVSPAILTLVVAPL